MPNPMKQRFSRKAKRNGQYESVEEQYKKLTHKCYALMLGERSAALQSRFIWRFAAAITAATMARYI